MHTQHANMQYAVQHGQNLTCMIFLTCLYNIEPTMPKCMHNMPMFITTVFIHMSVLMHNMPLFMQNANVHAQYAIM